MTDCELALTSLRISDAPLVALAAYGLLRVTTEEQELTTRFERPRLSWNANADGSDWHAVLTVRPRNDSECETALLEGLFNFLRRRVKNPESFWGLDSREIAKAIEKGGREEYEKLIESLAREGKSVRTVLMFGRWKGDRFILNPFFPSGGNIKPYRTFDLIIDYFREKYFGKNDGRRRKRVDDPVDAKEEEVKRKVTDRLRTSLLGEPWDFMDDCATLRLHRSILQEDAYVGYETGGNSLPTEGVGEWLAFEALPLFASFLTHGGRRVEFTAVREKIGSTAMKNPDWRATFWFPVWKTPITLSGLRSLLNAVTGELDVGMLKGLGVEHVFGVPQFRISSYTGVGAPEMVL